MDIEVGEYVRTNKGSIGKVTEILSGAIAPRVQLETIAVSTIMIKNHSKNIIDLIEVGDYVNGKEICLKDEKENAVVWGFQLKDEQRIFYLYEQDIKSIVTREQFKSVEYRLGE